MDIVGFTGSRLCFPQMKNLVSEFGKSVQLVNVPSPLSMLDLRINILKAPFLGLKQPAKPGIRA
jgi:hypothetical protein